MRHRQKKNANVRPELTKAVDNFDYYDIIFLEYPNWCGDKPMPVYAFIDGYHFSGKTEISICTHAESDLSGTVETLKGKIKDSAMLGGLATARTTAQNNQFYHGLDKLDINGKNTHVF